MKIKKQLISDTPYKYGKSNGKRFITVHQTGNTGKGADAQAHANLQSNGNVRNASWHWQVDDKVAIQSFDHDFQLWAAGDGRGNGNLNSIHVEICINSDGDYKKAVENGVKTVRHIMEMENIPLSHVRQHYDWSRKNCPAQIRAKRAGISWGDFLGLVGQSSSNTKAPTKTITQMAREVIDGKHGNGHDNRQRSLGVSPSVYSKVRNEVNRLLTGNAPTPQKSITDMAREVIAGKHGNGHDERRKSLGVSASVYEQVRRKVNAML